jgi:hypothetical protein
VIATFLQVPQLAIACFTACLSVGACAHIPKLTTEIKRAAAISSFGPNSNGISEELKKDFNEIATNEWGDNVKRLETGTYIDSGERIVVQNNMDSTKGILLLKDNANRGSTGYVVNTSNTSNDNQYLDNGNTCLTIKNVKQGEKIKILASSYRNDNMYEPKLVVYFKTSYGGISRIATYPLNKDISLIEVEANEYYGMDWNITLFGSSRTGLNIYGIEIIEPS